MSYLSRNYITFIIILLLTMPLLVNCKIPKPDPEKEKPVGLITINNKDASTDSKDVRLSLAAFDSTGVVGYYISENGSESDITEWTEVESTTGYYENISFTLSGGLGDKTVYAWFKNENDLVSATTSDSIKLIPFSGSIVINDGDSTTDSLTVRLSLISDVGTSYYISKSSELPTENIDWVTMDKLAGTTFIFEGSAGIKTIYAWFKNGDDVVSFSASDTIEVILSAEPATVSSRSLTTSYERLSLPPRHSGIGRNFEAGDISWTTYSLREYPNC
jgi:hypothetical protein